MYKSLLFCTVLFCCWACSTDAPNNTPTSQEVATPSASTMINNSLSAEEQADGWQLLFDGKSLQQWRGYHLADMPDEGWGIDEAGNLYTLGKGGDIITKAKFSDFELQLDFMLSDTGNSGVFYFVQELAKDRPIWHFAPEYQILDDDTYRKMSETGDITMHATADNYDMHSAEGATLKSVGEWNTAKIVVNGKQVEHWLNGKKVVSYELDSEDWKARYAKSKFSEYPEYAQGRKGHLGLQDHGHIIKFRNIKIKELNT